MTHVRNPVSGMPFSCAWDDCPRDGHDEFKVLERDGLLSLADGCSPLLVGTPKVIHWIFCSPRHKEYWQNAPRDHGNLPQGARGPLR